jgi:hypothetical protein
MLLTVQLESYQYMGLLEKTVTGRGETFDRSLSDTSPVPAMLASAAG